MGATALANGVYQVGVKDPNLAIFDIVIPTEHGTTYNAYLVRGTEKTALIDCVKRPFADVLFRNIEEICPVESIDYVVVNHSEPDHSGALADLLLRHPKVEVLLSRSAKTFIDNLVNAGYPFRIVADGDSVDLGGKTLSFVNAPFLHWPDTIFTWLAEERILFPCDFLGAHYSSDAVFNDELSRPEDARKAFEFYYATIMRPYKEHILAAAERIRALGPSIIAPSHGPVLRENPLSYLAYYEERASVMSRVVGKRIPIVYVSAYGNTEAMARKVAEGVEAGGAVPVLLNAVDTPTAAIIDEVEVASGILIGTPTLNANVPHPILEMVASFVFLNMRGKPASVFGSYGWSGEAIKTIHDILISMRLSVAPEPMKVRMAPSDTDLVACVTFGKAFAEIVTKERPRGG